MKNRSRRNCKGCLRRLDQEAIKALLLRSRFVADAVRNTRPACHVQPTSNTPS